jgi:hypothetical protein
LHLTGRQIRELTHNLGELRGTRLITLHLGHLRRFEDKLTGHAQETTHTLAPDAHTGHIAKRLDA